MKFNLTYWLTHSIDLDSSTQNFWGYSLVNTVMLSSALTVFVSPSVAFPAQDYNCQTRAVLVAQDAGTPDRDSRRYHADRGWKFLGNSQFQEAIDEFSYVIEIDPYYDDHIYIGRGMAYRNMGDYQASLQDLSTIIRINPFSAPYYERGMTYLALGETQKALDDFNQAIEDSGDYEWIADSYRQRGVIRHALGDGDGAIEDLQQALEKYHRIGMSSSPQYEETLQDFRRIRS